MFELLFLSSTGYLIFLAGKAIYYAWISFTIR